MDKIILGLFPDHQRIEEVIGVLKKEGYQAKNISLIMKDYEKTQEIGDSTGTNVTEGAVSGATTGGLVGAAAGLLIGIGAITIPGIGALLIGGPLAAALGLSGVAATTATGAFTGALAGGFVGALISLGVPEEQARIYEKRVKEGGVLLAVPVYEEQETEVRQLLQGYGASDFTAINAGDFATAGNYNTRSQTAGSRRKLQKNDKEDIVLANPVQVQKFLDDVDYPASREELISHAISHGADDNVQQTLRNIQNRRYRNPKEVSEAIGKIK